MPVPPSVTAAMNAAHAALGTDEEAVHEEARGRSRNAEDASLGSGERDKTDWADEDNVEDLMDMLDDEDDSSIEALAEIAKRLKRVRRY